MPFGATSPALTPPISDRDVVMRDALRRESIEVVSHQLQVERQEAARLRGADLLVGFALAGATLAIGLQLYELPVRLPRSRRS